MTSPEREQDAAARATDLYWGSDVSVNRLADELDVSKGTLYSLIRPLPADAGCPECGAPLVYPNRTARDRAVGSCEGCGWEGPLQQAVETASAPAERDTPAPPPATTWDPARKRVVAAGALLGAAAGLALAMWSRRR